MVTSGEGIADVAKAVRIERRGRDVYIIGAANVGKSAFVR
jgi:nitric-oxide synthase